MFEAYSVIPVAQKLPLTVDSLTSHNNLVQVHDLTQATFPVISVVPKSKNATFFTTCFYQAECNGTEHCSDENGNILLVVVVRRRCQLYTLKGTEFVEFSVLPEVVFADTIRYVALLDSYMVAVVRDEYFHITLNGDKAGVTSGTMRSLFTISNTSKNNEPMISVLWNRRIFAVKRGDETFFLRDDGSLALNDGYENIHWSEVPSFIVNRNTISEAQYANTSN
ncbi:Vam6/Vps39-like protein [Trichinella pseudospiralis]|uniref:Vam6/Vps39-like protein n=1 Tax=Trichinella pseudospiralis TaxID=6337 RepID=A0A0V0Y5J5_TRIPS|nr:Vam6/Vps39-like protein [Trichinella pseudospiralis]